MLGAACSSASLSNSELLGLHPPYVKIGRGWQRLHRFKSRKEIIREKLKQSVKKVSKIARRSVNICGLGDHKASECLTKSVGLPNTTA